MILTSYETAMRTAHNFLAVFLAKWVMRCLQLVLLKRSCSGVEITTLCD